MKQALWNVIGNLKIMLLCIVISQVVVFIRIVV